MGFFDSVYESELSHRARVVLIYLKDHADKEGKCWPGIKTIAAELGLSRSTVKGCERGEAEGEWGVFVEFILDTESEIVGSLVACMVPKIGIWCA